MKRLQFLGLFVSLLVTTGFAVAKQATPGTGQLLFTDGDIRLVNADGSDLRHLTDSAAYDTAPGWSPDGKHIAYISNLDGDFYGQYALLVMDADGQNTRQLADNATYGSVPEWSPDGSQIAYLTRDDNGDCIMDVVSVSGTEMREVVRKPHTKCDLLGLSLDWSPDGLTIAFDYDVKANYNQYQIFAVTLADGAITQLTATRDNERLPRWSPDGTRIAFVSSRDRNSEIYIMNADGSNVRRVTHRPGSDGGMYWFPDGKRLLFASYQRSYDLFTIGADGLNIKNLTADVESAAWSPVLSPDGERVAFVYGEDPVAGPDGIGIMNADGSELQPIAGLAAGYPSWRPDVSEQE